MVLACFFLSLSAGPVRAAAVPDPAAKAAMLVDAASGQVLWSRNPDQHMYPASITKILTALVAIEKGDLNDVVTVPKEAQGVEGSSLGLRAGETFTLKNLLYALLLDSANDSAVAIADHVGGSVPAFVQMMNDEARRLGAVDSHFANPHGLYDPDHYVTARDMAIITRAAMANPVFREIVATRYYTLPPRSDPKAQVDLVNHNRLLWTYPGAVGVKTGYIVASGETLVAAADRDGRELIAVVLDSVPGQTFSDAAGLLDYGFDRFARREIVGTNQVVVRLPVRFGVSGVDLVPRASFSYDFPVSASPDVERRVVTDQTVTAPVRQGQILGELVLDWQGTEIGRVPLVAARTVPRQLYTDWFFWVIVALVAASAVWLSTLAYVSRRRRIFGVRYRLRRR